MAPIGRTRKRGSKKPAKRAGSAKAVSVRLIVEPNENTPTYYMNYAELSVSPHEFSFLAVRAPTRPSQTDVASGEMRVEPLVQLLFAPTFLPALLRALNTVKDSYEKQHGTIRDGTKGKAKPK